MRRIIWMMSVSLDGFMEGPNHELDWQTIDEEIHQHFNDEIRSMSAGLDGRVTYELMAGFWPTADADPDESEQVKEFAGIWRDMPKYVFSTTLEHADWNTTILREVNPQEIEQLKAQPGGDMIVGGADLLQSLMRHDLVDEWRVYVHPVVIGEGKRAFAVDGATAALKLAETRTFASGVVLLKYERA